MFKRHALQVRMVKTDDTTADATPSLQLPTLDPTEINTLLKEQVRNLGATVLVVAAGVTALATAREVIVNNTNPQYK